MKNPVIKTSDENLAALSEELIKAGIIINTKPDTCWLDGGQCPYGLPEGTFKKRPRHVCWAGGSQGNGCPKLKEPGTKTELIEFSNILISEQAEPRLREVFDDFGRSLSSEITILAREGENESYKMSSLEKTILVTAAKIIEREEKKDDKAPIDNKIIRIRDFEDEILKLGLSLH